MLLRFELAAQAQKEGATRDREELKQKLDTATSDNERQRLQAQLTEAEKNVAKLESELKHTKQLWMDDRAMLYKSLDNNSDNKKACPHPPSIDSSILRTVDLEKNDLCA